ncbi:PAS domain S-box protein [bacterium]|nr:PAS domain S-box protein [bacterium]
MWKGTTKSSICLAGLLLLLMCFSLPSRADTLVKVGVYQNAPKVFIDNDGVLKGIFPDILEDIAAKENWRIEYVQGTWTECLARLEKGEIDLMLDVAYSEERAQRFDFTEETVLSNWSRVYVLRGSRIESILDLQSKDVALLKGSIQASTIKSLLTQFGITANIVEADTYPEVLELVESKAVDAGVITRLYGLEYAQNYNVDATPIVVCPAELRFALPKGKRLYLASTIDGHLKRMKLDADSAYERALGKWLGPGFGDEREIPKWIWRLLIGGAGILVLVFVLNLLLKAQVRARTFELTEERQRLLQEISVRKQAEGMLRTAERALRTISACNQAVIRATEESALLYEICQLIVDIGGYRLAWVGFAEQDEGKTVRPVAQAGYEEGYLETLNITWADTERGRGPTGTAIRTGEPTIVRDIQSDPAFAPWRDDATKRGYASSIALPLIFNGKTIGALSIYAARPDAFEEGEVKLLTELADDLAYGVVSLRVREERKRAVDALTESEERFKAISVSAQDAVITMDNNGRISYWNPTAETIFGYTSEETIGQEMHLLLAPQRYHEAYLSGFATFRETGSGPLIGKTTELVAVRKDGTEFPIELSLSAIKLEGTWSAVGIVRDITERKQAEEALRKSEESVRLMVSEVKDYAIIMLDPKGIISSWNEGAQRIKGYISEEIVGKHFSCLYPKEDVEAGKPDEELKVAAHEGRFEAEGWRVRKDGSRFIANVVITALRDDAGKLVGFSNITRDITERKQAEEELKKHRERLEELVDERTHELVERTAELVQANIRLLEADRLKSVFLADMSHELRTPLNSIIGFTGILLMGIAGDLSEEQKKQLTMVKNSAAHLLSLINDLLDISRIEAGKVEVSLEEFGLDAVVSEVADSFLSAVSEKGLELLIDVAEGVTLFSDRRRLKQILMNLVSNAVKFTEHGSVRITGKVITGRGLEMRVTDTGIGIKREDMSKLFLPFQQVDASLTKKHEGTGLGLHLTKKLVTLLGGEIWAASEHGKGSEFVFVIPLKYREEPIDEEDSRD